MADQEEGVERQAPPMEPAEEEQPNPSSPPGEEPAAAEEGEQPAPAEEGGAADEEPVATERGLLDTDETPGQTEGEVEVQEGDLAEIRERITRRQEGDRLVTDASLGGLLDETGRDIRRTEEEIAAGDGDTRRGRAWRGRERTHEAAIQFDYCMETFDYKIQASLLGADLRIFAVFVVWFCFFFLVGRNINQNHYFARAVTDPVFSSEIAQLKEAKFFPDISEAHEFNLWVLDVFLYQTIDLEYVTGGNFFLGATRFRTQRVRKDTCSINADIIPASMPPSAQECYGEWDSDNADVGIEDNAYNAVGRWKYKSCQEWLYGSYITGIIDRYDCGGYFFEVPWWRPIDKSDPESVANGAGFPFPSTEYERMPKTIAEFQYVVPALTNNPPFVDNLATRMVVLEWFTYQPTLGTFLSIKAYAEVATGGLWKTNKQVRVFEIWTMNDLVKTILVDGTFFLFVLFYIYNFFADLMRFRRQNKKTLAFFFNLWNLMEIANLIIFIVVFGFRIAWISESVKASPLLDELGYSAVYPAQLDNILDNFMFQVYLNSVNTVLTFLKILKFFRLNDRLNILTRTLSESQDSIIGVLFIFLLVVTAFAMTGHGLFGLGVWRFRSIDSSFSTLLLILLGQFDYQAMKNENRVLAGLFFWAYIILALFCLLNFLIGVLMEAFAEVSASKSVLPLETVLVKTWADLKKILAPSNIKKYFTNLCRRTSREQLMVEALDNLKKFRTELYSPDDDVPIPEEKQMAYREDFFDGIGEELVSRIGEDYLAYVWDDLVYEWDQSTNAQEAIDARRNLEMTTKGVRLAIGKQLERIEGFSSRMAALETQLNHLAQVLDA